MYFEQIRVDVKLGEDIKFKDAGEFISAMINNAIRYDKELFLKHNINTFKHYCFSSFYPPEKDGIYKKNERYNFDIRSLDSSFIEKVEHFLSVDKNSKCKVIKIKKTRVKQFFISELYTVTPAVVSFEDENKKLYHWTMQRDGDILKLQNALQNNLLRKYKSFYGYEPKPMQNFIQLLELKNQKPQTTNYKGIRLFGNKFRIIPNEDEVSQKLAFMALSSGLGEKGSSVGVGFCVGRENQAFRGLVR